MKLKTIKDLKLKGKTVILRVDFNVAMKHGNILDDFRLREEVKPALNLIKKGARIIIIAHLGRPDENNKKDLSLKPISEHFSKLIKKPIHFDSLDNPDLMSLVKKMKNGSVLFLENLRFYEGEEKNSSEFAKRLAGLGDIFINDAFAVSHRAHASVHAITRFMPSYAGELMEKEVEVLSRLRENPARPLTVIIGGAKISTKMKLIQIFLDKKECDHVLVGGALANNILLAMGVGIGKSMVEPGMTEEVKKLDITKTKLHIPFDVIVSTNPEENKKNQAAIRAVGRVGNDEAIYDIGPDTLSIFKKIIAKSKMIVWNGPMGFFEIEQFAKGSYEVAKAVTDSGAFSIIGGGETAVILEHLKVLKKISHISTGGGAMMEFLGGELLPGVEILRDRTAN
jgi:phosphoglycerate kinase